MQTLGHVQVIAIPLINLTPKKGKDIKELGPPRAFLSSVGPYIGDDRDSFDEENVVSAEVEEGRPGGTFYVYELANPYAKYAAHSVAALSIRGDVAFLVEASATEAQWRSSEPVLRSVVNSFTV